MSENQTIAYLVSGNYRDVLARSRLFRDEHALLTPYFAKLGYRCEPIDWRDPSQDWSRFAGIIPKAVWDYHERPSAFAEFCGLIENRGYPMRNYARTVSWNMDKRYLLDLDKRGLPVVPLAIHPRGGPPEESWFRQFGDEVLVKPTVSAGSHHTIRFSAERWREHGDVFRAILSAGDLIVQPFVKEIQTAGEYSYFYFGGEFSHCVHKVPSTGDFRAHSYFGAEFSSYTPTPEEISSVGKFLHGTPDPCAYARIDVIPFRNSLRLVELELIEPYLYAEYTDSPRALAAFAQAVVDSLPSAK